MANDFSATTGRAHWTMALEIVTRQPLTTGMGSDGNEQMLRTFSYRAYDRELGEWVEGEVPHVSGQAFKATLREHAFLVMAEALGLREGEVSRDGLRLILKGGKNDKGETSVSLDDLRAMRKLLPILDIFGALDQGQALPASGQFSDVRPYCTELVAADLVPQHIKGGRGQHTKTIQIYPDMLPIPAHLCRDSVQNFRHDLSQTQIAHVLMTDQDKTKLVDARAEKKASAKPAKAEERRAINESMPYTLQCIPAGVPMFALIRLVDASPVAAALLSAATEHWIRSGAHLGSGKSVGRGACRVRVAGAFAVDSRTGELWVDGSEAAFVDSDTAMVREGSSPYAEALRAHLSENAAAIRAKLAEVVR